MRRVLMVAAAMAVLGTSATAHAQTIRFTANLSGADETPAPGVLTGAFGTATVTLDLGTGTVTWNIDVFNMTRRLTPPRRTDAYASAGPGAFGARQERLTPRNTTLLLASAASESCGGAYGKDVLLANIRASLARLRSQRVFLSS